MRCQVTAVLFLQESPGGISEKKWHGAGSLGWECLKRNLSGHSGPPFLSLFSSLPVSLSPSPLPLFLLFFRRLPRSTGRPPYAGPGRKRNQWSRSRKPFFLACATLRDSFCDAPRVLRRSQSSYVRVAHARRIAPGRGCLENDAQATDSPTTSGKKREVEAKFFWPYLLTIGT